MVSEKSFGRPTIYSFSERSLTNISTSRMVEYTHTLLISRKLSIAFGTCISTPVTQYWYTREMFSDYPRCVHDLICVYKNSRWLFKRNTCPERGSSEKHIKPPLFSIFINDIRTAMNGNHSPSINNNTVQIPRFMYADDIVILPQTKTGFQNKLDRLCDYCKAWSLQINREKRSPSLLAETQNLSYSSNVE